MGIPSYLSYLTGLPVAEVPVHPEILEVEEMGLGDR
jgi:hypothetical protein